MARKTPGWKPTLRQKMFIEKYISNGFNGTQAAISAGYSVRTANEQASRLLANVNIKTILEKRIRDLLSDTESMTVQWLKQVNNICEFDIRKVADWEEDELVFKPSSEIDDDTALAISEISCIRTGGKNPSSSMKIKALDKNRALEMKAKFLGIIGDGFAVAERSEENPVDSEAQSPAERRDRIAELYRQLNGKVE